VTTQRDAEQEPFRSRFEQKSERFRLSRDNLDENG